MIGNLPTTEALVDQLKSAPTLRSLCGWDARRQIPKRSTFSRAFNAFAIGKLPQLAHEALIQKYGATRLVGHSSHDATVIEAREKPLLKTTSSPQSKAKRGRPQRDTPPTPKEPRRLELQPLRTLAENLADLPTAAISAASATAKGIRNLGSALKDNYGGRFVRVRGPAKVMCHLMFGLWR